MKFSTLMFLGACLFITSLLLFLGCDSTGRVTPDNTKLVRFASCDELARTLKATTPQNAYETGGDPVLAPAADGSTGGSKTVGETNLQVAGVDEADIAKADGNFLYTLNSSGSSLFSLKRIPGASASVLQKIILTDMQAQGLFLTADRLIVVGTEITDSLDACVVEPMGGVALGDASWCPFYTNRTLIKFFQRNGDGTLELLGHRSVDGAFSDARLTDGRLHLVLFNYIYNAEPFTEETVVDSMPTTGIDSTRKALASCTDILHERALTTVSSDMMPSTNNLLCVASLDASDFSKEPKSQCILADGSSTIHGSPTDLFIASWGWEDTPIHQFALNNVEAGPQYMGTALVPGWLLNQFSMDEYDGYLRVATHKENYGSSTNQLSVFRLTDGDPILAATLGDLGKGEQIYAARFLGDKGFVVTFKNVDPLYAVDLSDPEHPVLRGELKIPGYSSYLHPMKDGYLMGVGKDAEAAESEDFAWYQGMALSIFDVRDLDNPKLVQKISIGSRGTDSEALYNHKAFRYDPDTNLVIFPIDLFTGGSTPSDYGTHAFSGFHIYSATVEDGFHLVGQSEFEAMDCEYCWYSTTGRSFIHDGSIALVGGNELVTRAASTPNTDLARVSIE